MRHILLRPEPSGVLSSRACFFPLGPPGWGLESKSALGALSTLRCWSMRMLVVMVRRHRKDSQYHGSARCCWL